MNVGIQKSTALEKSVPKSEKCERFIHANDVFDLRYSCNKALTIILHWWLCYDIAVDQSVLNVYNTLYGVDQ